MKLFSFNLACIFVSFLPGMQCAASCHGKRCGDYTPGDLYVYFDSKSCSDTACSTSADCPSGQSCESADEAFWESVYLNDPCCDGKKSRCFSSRSSTVVMDKGETLVKDLQVGDYVLTGSGDYKKVYTIDHRNTDVPTEFVQLYTSAADVPLEVTAGHLVFLHNKVDPIPASGVKVGDILQSLIGENSEVEPAVVTNIAPVIRKGLWNPITEDGTIIVDGIITSTYNSVVLVGGDEYIEISGYKLVSLQDFFHVLLTPYRSACMSLPTSVAMDLCGIAEDDEFNLYDKVGLEVMNACQSQHPMFRNAIVIGALAFFSALYFVFANHIALGVMFFSVLVVYKSGKKIIINN